MASYYPPPPSSPLAGPIASPRPDYYQGSPLRPTMVEQVQTDVCASVQMPVCPTPPTVVQSAVLQTTTTTTTTTSVVKVYKTYLQWKAEAKAATADYQCNGFPSPVAWVITPFTPHLRSLIAMLSRFM